MLKGILNKFLTRKKENTSADIDTAYAALSVPAIPFMMLMRLLPTDVCGLTKVEQLCNFVQGD